MLAKTSRQRMGTVQSNREEASSMLSLSSVTSFLKHLSWWLKSCVLHLYLLFIFEPLHNFYLRISILLEQDAVRHTASQHLTVKGVDKGGRFSARCFSKRTVLRGCNSLLNCTDKDSNVPGARMDCSKMKTSTTFRCLFTATNIRGILERKNCRNMASLIPFEAAYTDRDTGSKIEHWRIKHDSNTLGFLLSWRAGSHVIELLQQRMVRYRKKRRNWKPWWYVCSKRIVAMVCLQSDLIHQMPLRLIYSASKVCRCLIVHCFNDTMLTWNECIARRRKEFPSTWLRKWSR